MTRSLPNPFPSSAPTYQLVKDVVEEHLKVVGVAHGEGMGIWMLECQLLVAEIKGLPTVPPDVCSVKEQPKKSRRIETCPSSFCSRSICRPDMLP